MSKFENLAKLKELHDAGVLSDEEYEAEKKKVLDAPETAAQTDAASPASQPQIVINNSNTNMNQNLIGMGIVKEKNKWIALALCFFLGYIGAHKFYEGKIGLGILYLFTGGLFFIGVVIDFISLLTKPNPYYVR